jgi:hypothetical protein
MLRQKFIAVITADAFAKLREDSRLIGAYVEASGIPNSTNVMVAFQSQHANLRFDLATVEGITVLPGVHDPTPIGDLHQHLGHVNAQPQETMRTVALRLHTTHGPVFHPDT